jgi:4-amino-4-deoxy-L-arabinose transferase-like glycosyltransferase
MAWLLPGLVGHDPWKTDEAMAFGVVAEILATGDWVNFRIAGEPLLGEPPLFLWTAALLGKLLGGCFRCTTPLDSRPASIMAATMALVSAASWELMGERAVRMSVLLLIGCLGLLIRAHEMTPELAGLAGIALAIYGLALVARRQWLGGALTGLGIGVAYLGNGLAAGGHAGHAARDPADRIARMAQPPLRDGRGRGARVCRALRARLVPGNSRGWRLRAGSNRGVPYFLKLLTWYAWPAWPLSAWAVWRARRNLATRTELHLPIVAFAAFFVVIAVFAESRDLSALPILLPLAILGVAELESLPRGAASALDWFGMMTFVLLAALLWIGWGAALTGRPEFAAAFLQKELPGFTYQFRFLSFALAALLTLVWIVVVARSLRSPRRALVNWAAGITMVWMLVMTLGVPLVDQARSYRAVSARLVRALPPTSSASRAATWATHSAPCSTTSQTCAPSPPSSRRRTAAARSWSRPRRCASRRGPGVEGSLAWLASRRHNELFIVYRRSALRPVPGCRSA